MKKINTEKLISDIEDINYNSETLAGLSSVLLAFFETSYEDENLMKVFIILLDEAYKMQDKCKSLLKFAMDN